MGIHKKDYYLGMDETLGSRLRKLQGPVLITGHTGFKGSWLTLLFEHLSVPVIGLSLPPEKGSLYARAQREGKIVEKFIDIRDPISVRQFITTHRPSAVIHMAAQPLVLESYKIPSETFEINVMGTVNVLEASFQTDSVEAIVVVTTDKVYRNNNSEVSFVESDPLAGNDPYSASKVGTESVVAAWQQISKVSGGPKVISVRAGNVLGGGDLAENRIIPELIRGFLSQKTIRIRNPFSTRPWQHVLDPLRGYVMALESTLCGIPIEALNFGPSSPSLTVQDIVKVSRENWPSQTSVEFMNSSLDSHLESTSLEIDSRKARMVLGWDSRWNQEESVIATIQWWDKVLNNSIDPVDACNFDIEFLLSE
jgi:CDP-glucose 4,6-dehydratase